MKTFWLSFADQDTGEFKGVAVVEVTATDADIAKIDLVRRFPKHKHGSEWLAAAMTKAWKLGCNPGGTVASWEMPPDHPETKRAPRNRLMLRTELIERDLGEFNTGRKRR